MLTLDEAIKHCEEKAKELRVEAEAETYRDIPNNPAISDCLECANEHEQLADWLTELQERREADRWIPVSEKLPDEYGNYLVFTSDKDIDIGTYQPRYIVGTWSMCDSNGFYWADDKDIKVLAWKPLPKPYQKGGKKMTENKGEWIEREDMDYIDENKVVHNHFECNKCGLIHDFIDGHTSQYNFCPNCGADMRGEE